MKLLIPIDDRVFGEVILAFLAEQDWPASLDLRILHVIGPFQSALNWPSKIVEHEAASLVQSTALRFKRRFPKALVDCEVLHGNIASNILQAADTWPADMIIMGSHARTNVARKFMGSVSSQVAKESNHPVIVLRPSMKGSSDSDGDKIQPIWLEEMSLEHERYLLDHADEKPFPLDGSDWARLVQLRLEHEYEHQGSTCNCADFLTKLHSIDSPLRGEREAEWRAFEYWFEKDPQQYKPALEGKDAMPLHAMKVLAQVDSSIHIQEVEKEWLKSRIKAWTPGTAPYWIAEKGDAWESGNQLTKATPALEAKEISTEVAVNVKAGEN